MWLPSGDQSGSVSTPGASISNLGDPPFSGTIQISTSPSFPVAMAICRPSGDHDIATSFPAPTPICVALPPSAGTSQIFLFSPSCGINATVFPSGDQLTLLRPGSRKPPWVSAFSVLPSTATLQRSAPCGPNLAMAISSPSGDQLAPFADTMSTSPAITPDSPSAAVIAHGASMGRCQVKMIRRPSGAQAGWTSTEPGVSVR